MTIIDQIWNLSRGKPTKDKIGSRRVPHRLTKYERETVERAIKKGFLEHHHASRMNAKNIYLKLCVARNLTPIIITFSPKDSRVEYLGVERTFETRKMAKEFASSLAKGEGR